MLVRQCAAVRLLQDSLARCLAGAGGLTVISGPVGSGKTELLHRLAQDATNAGAVFIRADAIRADRPTPLSVPAQLMTSLALPDSQAERVSRLLEDGVLSALLHDSEDETAARVANPVVQQLTSVLLAAPEATPLIIGIDDAHFMDVASLQWLLYLIRRIGRARVLVLAVESTSVRQPWPLLWAELLSQPGCRRARVAPLSPGEITEFLAQHPSLPGSRDPDLWHDVTGGNPRLISALADDVRTGRGQAPAQSAGAAFGQAVLTCLLRSDPILLPLARILAVLEEPAAAALLSEMLETGVASVNWALDAAKEAGLLASGRFRHRQARSAVLAATRPQEQMALHKSVAYLLYRSGAPAMAVARHKIAAFYADAPWSRVVLREAAEQALEEDDIGLALDCLRLAERGQVGEAERASIQSVTVRTKWRLDPASAERDMAELLQASQAGLLSVQHAVELVSRLSWYGRPAEAAEVLTRASAGPAGGGLPAALRNAETRLAYTYPGLFGRSAGQRASQGPPGSPTAGERVSARADGILGTLLADGLTRQVLDDAETVLRQSRLSDQTYVPVMDSLEALVLAECLDEAAFWCDALLLEAQRRRAPTWCAQFSAIRAMISLRQGNLLESEQHGRMALSRIQPRGFGVLIGSPLATLVLAAIRIGQYDTALSHLSVRVPDAMFQTPAGLRYLRARGRYYLARQRHREAIEDFETCGRLMIEWGIDLPGLVPWRTDLAEANLAVGAPGRDLALEQLARIGPFNKRTRGISLRVLAAATEPRKRLPILWEAVDVLQASGDQLELADALADLSRTQHALGEYSKARVTSRRAQQIAKQSRAPEPEAAEPARPGEDPIVLKLSDAERRVASLAAQGYTNRQISGKLYITVSTVEQHLTRVYRKLQVTRRGDLPVTLLSSGHLLTSSSSTA